MCGLTKVVIQSGLSHGQEKSGKTKKNDKSQEKWEVFEKIQEKVRNFFFKPQIQSVQIYLIAFISKPSISKKLIKNSLKSD